MYYITQNEKPGVFAVKNMTLAGAGILNVHAYTQYIILYYFIILYTIAARLMFNGQ